jgi:hypothetical protein
MVNRVYVVDMHLVVRGCSEGRVTNWIRFYVQDRGTREALVGPVVVVVQKLVNVLGVRPYCEE